MPTRRETLDRLKIGIACKASWDAMTGDETRRFCTECSREVLDFARLTPREIHALLEASRGRLCARITRIGGRLSVLEPEEPFEPMRSSPPRRASSFAATFVTAWLGAGVVEAAPPTSPTAPPATASGLDSAADHEKLVISRAARNPHSGIRGQVTNEGRRPLPGASIVARQILDGREHSTVARSDGAFAFETLPAGIYEIAVKVEGFEDVLIHDVILESARSRRLNIQAAIDPVSTRIFMGDILFQPDPLRRLFEQSDIVAEAIVGRTTLIAREGNISRVSTELHVESWIKGRIPGSAVSYLHSVYSSEPEKPVEDTNAGRRILAFLTRAPSTGAHGESGYEALPRTGIRRFYAEPERKAYLHRLEGLAVLDAEAGRRGENDPDSLVEWLVGTAENPLTRQEATAELLASVEALQALAVREETTVQSAAADLLAAFDRYRAEGGIVTRGDDPALLAAFLTLRRKARLTDALASAETLSPHDFDLFAMVRTWEGDAATARILAKLCADGPEEADIRLISNLYLLAKAIDDQDLLALAEESLARDREIDLLWPEDRSQETQQLRNEKRRALRAGVRRGLEEKLAAKSRP